MERVEAVAKIKELIGQDLRPLADQFFITVEKAGGGINKGWAGHVIERYLGLPLNSSQSPNFGSWELKVVPVRRVGITFKVKETMAITMIDAYNVQQKPFEDSHLYSKLRKMVVVSRVFESKEEKSSLVHNVATFDLDNPAILETVRQDYELVRAAIAMNGFHSLTGRMGKYIQPRTKGQGGDSPKTRAFYARVGFVAHILNLPGAIAPVLPDLGAATLEDIEQEGLGE